MLLVTVLGFAISDCFNVLDAFIARKVLKKEKPPDSHSTACVMLVSLTVFWTILSGMVAKWINDWWFIDGIYCAFVTFTTIGYGDFSFGDNGSVLNENELISWYAAIGLTLLAGTVDMIIKMFKANTLKCDTKNDTKLEEKASAEI